MAQIKYRVKLTQKGFPFNLINFGQSVIVSGVDQNVANNYDEDNNVPQAYYLENVLPTEYGYSSVGYLPLSTYIYYSDITNTNLSSAAFTLKNANRAEIFASTYIDIASSTHGAAIRFSAVGDSINYTVAIAGTYLGTDVKILNFNYIAYGLRQFVLVRIIYASGTSRSIKTIINELTYNSATSLPILSQVNPSGFATTAVLDSIIGGITSFGYIVLWSTDTIYWSSLTNPFDFAPSIVSGAGYATPQQLKNNITACVPHVAGFMIFTGSNAVMATYQNSTLQPFYFKEIVNAAGIDNADRVDTDANTTNFLAYTDAGIQVISTTTAQVQFPEVVDFINKGPAVKLNVGQTITYTQDAPQFGQLTIILDRYLCISYKAGTLNNYRYNWILIYDFALKRWGQLYCPHNAVLSRDNTMYLAGSVSDSASGSYLSVKVGNLNNSQAKLLLGKYQYIRARLIQFDELLLSSVYTDSSVKIIPSITGQLSNLPVVTPYTVTISGTLRKYLSRVVGKNISLLIQGDFDLTSGELTFNVDSKR